MEEITRNSSIYTARELCKKIQKKNNTNSRRLNDILSGVEEEINEVKFTY